ncbi:MAG: LamG-like jellyroll fold domain-containing protein [candidate division KSB1 bacterium]|nr:LamG-like jellyroll fold domain-containing protein [candidate division KSB1 bacterium]
MYKLIVYLLILLISSLTAADLNIIDFGAKSGQYTDNTRAVQSAIDVCHEQGGGTVIFPSGLFRTGSIELKSHVSVFLSNGTVWKGIPDPDLYPELDHGAITRMSQTTQKAMIYSIDAEHIHIHGNGMIYPGGDDNVFQDQITDSKMRPYGLFFIRCRDVSISGIHMQNSAFWMQRYLECDRVRLSGLTIYNHSNLNNDGLDIDGCHDVRISDCHIDASDDALCLKAEGHRGVRDVVISNCILSSHATAFKLGTGSVGGFQRITLDNCIIRPSKAAKMHHVLESWRGLAGIELLSVDGGDLQDVHISNVLIDSVETPIHIKLGNRHDRVPLSAPAPDPGLISDISLQHIRIRDAGLISSAITGYPEHPVRRIQFHDITIQSEGGGAGDDTLLNVPEVSSSYPMNRIYGVNLPAFGFYFRHVKDIQFSDIHFSLLSDDERPAVVLDDVHSADFTGIHSSRLDAPPVLRVHNSTDITVSADSLWSLMDLIRVSGDRSTQFRFPGHDFNFDELLIPPENLKAEPVPGNPPGIQITWTPPAVRDAGLFRTLIKRDGEPLAHSRDSSWFDASADQARLYVYSIATVGPGGGISKTRQARITGLGDTTPPAVQDIRLVDPQHVMLEFSEPVDTLSFTDQGTSIQPDIEIKSIQFQEGGRTALIGMGTIEPQTDYTLHVNRLSDRSPDGNTVQDLKLTFRDQPVTGYWSFDTIRDGAIVSEKCTCRVYHARQVQGIKQSALYFNGENAYVECPCPDTFNLSGDMAVSVWVKLEDPDLSSFTRVLSKKPRWDDSTGYELEINPHIDKINFCGGSRNEREQGEIRYNLDSNWHHLLAEKRGSAISFYIDNQWFATDSFAVDAAPNSVPLIIGSNPSLYAFFKGALDELILFNRALSPAERDKLYQREYWFKP